MAKTQRRSFNAVVPILHKNAIALICALEYSIFEADRACAKPGPERTRFVLEHLISSSGAQGTLRSRWRSLAFGDDVEPYPGVAPDIQVKGEQAAAELEAEGRPAVARLIRLRNRGITPPEEDLRAAERELSDEHNRGFRGSSLNAQERTRRREGSPPRK